MPFSKPALCVSFASFAISAGMCFAQQPQQQPTPPAQTQPLPTPAMTGPLQTPPPITFDCGPFGKLDLTGIVSGMGLWQGNLIPGDSSPHGDLSNGQVFIQKTEGWWQFYVQAGAYNIPQLGISFLSTADTIKNFYTPLPVAFLKLAPSKNFNILIGQLPTLIGAEYTFTFENMNVERGLLWEQENAINRGIQANGTLGKLSASLSWNDGFYSNRYSWISGSLAYAFNAANTLSFVAGGNLGQTVFRSLAIPVQNNGSIYDVIYTYTKGNWIIQPYFQYTDVPTNQKVAIIKGAATRSGALLMNYNFKHNLSLAGRGEYISSTGSAAQQSVNLIFGPGSGGWSFTVTPTIQSHGFFMRGEFSLVRAARYTPGAAFGALGMNSTQTRGLAELGFMF